MAEKEKELPLPHSIEAEQQLLGVIMARNDVYVKVSAFLRPNDFYSPVHEQIYEQIEFLIGEDRIATPITLARQCSEITFEEGFTPASYLAALSAAACPPAQAEDYAKMIKDDSLKRQLWIHTEKVRKQVMNPATMSSEILDATENFVADARPQSARAEQFRPFSRAVSGAIGIATAAYEKGSVISGLSSGIPKVDAALGGLNRSDLIVLAGRPGMGKTALAINIAFNYARSLKERRNEGQQTGVVGFFSLEMPDNQIANRIIAEDARVSSWRVRSGAVGQPEITRFLEAGERLKDLPIMIDQTGALPINQLVTRARALHRRQKLEMLLIDYLQLMRGSSTGGRNRDTNRVQEVTEITTSLKALAKDLDIPVIALSQLSRQVEQRDDKRPKLADLRESGSIEQDADVVVFIYRDEYYLKQSEPRPGTEAHNEWQVLVDRAHGRAECIVAKNRHGPPTTVVLGYDSAHTRFHDDPPEDVANNPAPKEKRERKKALNLSKQATVCFGMIQTMELTASIENDSHVGNVPKGTKLIRYVQWRERCANEVLDPGHSEKQAISLMEKVVPELIAAKIIGRGGSKEDPFIWRIAEKK